MMLASAQTILHQSQLGGRFLAINSSDRQRSRCVISMSAARQTFRPIQYHVCMSVPQIAPLWLGAQLTFNFSLSMTNVTSNTILSSTSSLFTFGLSCVLLGETYTSLKLLSIMVCIAGRFCSAVLPHPSRCCACQATACCHTRQCSDPTACCNHC